MEYLKWLILDKHREDFFENGAFVLAISVNLMILFTLSLVSMVLNIALFVLSVVFWSIPVFFFAQEIYNESIAEYNDAKNKKEKS